MWVLLTTLLFATLGILGTSAIITFNVLSRLPMDWEEFSRGKYSCEDAERVEIITDVSTVNLEGRCYKVAVNAQVESLKVDVGEIEVAENGQVGILKLGVGEVVNGGKILRVNLGIGDILNRGEIGTAEVGIGEVENFGVIKGRVSVGIGEIENDPADEDSGEYRE